MPRTSTPGGTVKFMDGTTGTISLSGGKATLISNLSVSGTKRMGDDAMQGEYVRRIRERLRDILVVAAVNYPGRGCHNVSRPIEIYGAGSPTF
jgi:hypothetical protein